MRYGPKLSEQPIDGVIGKHHWVATGHDYITDFRARPNVVDAELERLPIPPARFADLSFAGAEPTVNRTLMVHKEQNPVWVAVRQVRYRAISLFIEGVVGAILVFEFCGVGYHLTPYRIPRLLD